MKKIKKVVRETVFFIKDADAIDTFRDLLTLIGDNTMLGWDSSYEEDDSVNSGYLSYDKEHKLYKMSKLKP